MAANPEATRKKFRHRYLIGGVQYCWGRPARLQSLAGKPQTGKTVQIGRFEI